MLRNFEVIGEAAKKRSERDTLEYDDVPWSEMAEICDKPIHGYATLKLRIVWSTVQEEIPALIRRSSRFETNSHEIARVRAAKPKRRE